MLSIGRALLLNPELLILDEPSQGLAPLIVREVFAIVGPDAQRRLSFQELRNGRRRHAICVERAATGLSQRGSCTLTSTSACRCRAPTHRPCPARPEYIRSVVSAVRTNWSCQRPRIAPAWAGRDCSRSSRGIARQHRSDHLNPRTERAAIRQESSRATPHQRAVESDRSGWLPDACERGRSCRHWA